MARNVNEMLGANEKLVLSTRQHPLALILKSSRAFLLLICTLLLQWVVHKVSWLDNRAGEWVSVALWVLVAVSVIAIVWYTLSWANERLYLTTNKVVYSYGVLNHNMMSTPFVKIDEVALHRSFFGRLFGFGWIEVENAAGGKQALAGLKYLPKPAALYHEIVDRSRHQRMLEGGMHRDRDGDGYVDDE